MKKHNFTKHEEYYSFKIFRKPFSSLSTIDNEDYNLPKQLREVHTSGTSKLILWSNLVKKLRFYLLFICVCDEFHSAWGALITQTLNITLANINKSSQHKTLKLHIKLKN